MTELGLEPDKDNLVYFEYSQLREANCQLKPLVRRIGIVEGLNNRLKLIKCLGYGFRNFENFRLRCLMCWHLAIS